MLLSLMSLILRYNRWSFFSFYFADAVEGEEVDDTFGVEDAAEVNKVQVHAVLLAQTNLLIDKDND